MTKYRVMRKRAYWVKEIVEIDADSFEQAEELFFDNFDPELVIEGVFDFHGQRFETPMEVKVISTKEGGES